MSDWSQNPMGGYLNQDMNDDYQQQATQFMGPSPELEKYRIKYPLLTDFIEDRVASGCGNWDKLSFENKGELIVTLLEDMDDEGDCTLYQSFFTDNEELINADSYCYEVLLRDHIRMIFRDITGLRKIAIHKVYMKYYELVDDIFREASNV